MPLTAVATLICLASAARPVPVVAAPLPTLQNDAYTIVPQANGSLHVQSVGGERATIFRPAFVVWQAKEPVTLASVKWDKPVYNLAGWKFADGRLERDLYRAGRTITLTNPEVTTVDGALHWKFAHEEVALEADVTLPPGRGEPRIRYTFTPAAAGQWSAAYAGAPEADLDDVVELWQPLVWDGRRLPDEAFLIPDEQCSIPGCLVETKTGTVGVLAEPRQFPFLMPSRLLWRFGVAVRNASGKAQPLVFTPFPGFADSQTKAGERKTFDVVLVARTDDLSKTFEHAARNVCGFRDRRENTLSNLNGALDRMCEYSQGPFGHFDPPHKAFSYPDSPGTVKNVSSLHPIGLALATDDAKLFNTIGVPLLEFLLSREKFLFALSGESLEKSSQTPSRRLAGPAMPTSELAALQRLTHGATPYFRTATERLATKDRTLNMEWVSRGDAWQNDLWLYRATGDAAHLRRAIDKADRYVADRLDREPTDFAEADDGTFFEYMVPWWKDLYELYLDTHEPRHLAAAHRGARRYAQFVWFYPSVPEGDVTVNESGIAPRRGSLDKPGLLPVAKETVPAWRVADEGLICEGNGTVQRLGILLATHAPFFLRIAHDADDPFLREIARSAIVGRFANFPGYHLNTVFSTAQEKPDFPLHSFEELKPTTSLHYNHSLPMANLALDYLAANVYDRSDGAIDFPAEYAEGYAYLQGRVYGNDAAKFYDVEGARLWMPRGLVRFDNVQVNYVAARTDDGLCLALTNECDRPLENVTFRLDPDRFAKPLAGERTAFLWQDNRSMSKKIAIVDGVGTVSLSPKGITAIHIEGVTPKVSFQTAWHARDVRPKGPRATFLRTPLGEAPAIVISFGPKLTWLYAYLATDDRAAKSATLEVEIAGRKQRFTDDEFPLEFSVPMAVAPGEIGLTLEVAAPTGKTERSETTKLSY